MFYKKPASITLPLMIALWAFFFVVPGLKAEPHDGFQIHLLSAADQALYKDIYRLQEDGRWTEADKLIAQLSDPVLLGHVQFQRYMHPTKYRSSFRELSDWMSAYADLPGANRIYSLARKRQGSARTPKSPEPLVSGDGNGTSSPKPKSPPDTRTKSDRDALHRFQSRFRTEIRRNNPGRAEKRLWAFEKREIFTDQEFVEALTDVAENYFYNGDDEKAVALSTLAVELSPNYLTQANWIAGISAWRAGLCRVSSVHFSNLANNEARYPGIKAAGAFWAARSYLACKEPDKVGALLRLAAAQKYTFYGLIAARQLGTTPDFNWDKLPLDYDHYLKLLNLEGVKRAVALAEVGQYDLADEELRMVWNRRQYDDYKDIIALASRLDLPATQALLARGSEKPEELPDSAFFPVPKWQPEGGFKIDRALILGFMRQESHYLPKAHSGAGAYGLMQLMPATASFITGDRSLRWSGKSKLLIPEVNLGISQTYMLKLFADEVTDGNLLKFASAYNGGPGNLGRWENRINYNQDPLLFIETIPFYETRDFIEKVLANMWIYRIQFGQPTPGLDAVASGAWPVYERLDDEFDQAFRETPANVAPGGS